MHGASCISIVTYASTSCRRRKGELAACLWCCGGGGAHQATCAVPSVAHMHAAVRIKGGAAHKGAQRRAVPRRRGGEHHVLLHLAALKLQGVADGGLDDHVRGDAVRCTCTRASHGPHTRPPSAPACMPRLFMWSRGGSVMHACRERGGLRRHADVGSQLACQARPAEHAIAWYRRVTRITAARRVAPQIQQAGQEQNHRPGPTHPRHSWPGVDVPVMTSTAGAVMKATGACCWCARSHRRFS